MNPFRILAALLVLLVAPCMTPANAGPLRVSFYDCGAYVDCKTEAPTLMAQFVTDSPLQVPNVPPAGSVSSAEAVPITQVLAGAWSGVGIQSFNLNGYLGSSFLFFDLFAADGFQGGQASMVAAGVAEALRLTWTEGTYLGFGRVRCYTLSCSVTTPILSYEKIVIDAWTEPPVTVPEPGALPLVAVALALGGLAMRRRGRGLPGR